MNCLITFPKIRFFKCSQSRRILVSDWNCRGKNLSTFSSKNFFHFTFIKFFYSCWAGNSSYSIELYLREYTFILVSLKHVNESFSLILFLRKHAGACRRFQMGIFFSFRNKYQFCLSCLLVGWWCNHFHLYQLFIHEVQMHILFYCVQNGELQLSCSKNFVLLSLLRILFTVFYLGRSCNYERYA